MLTNHRTQIIVTHLFLLIILALASNASASQWKYKQSKEKLTDKQYSFALNFAFDYKYNNDFTISFQCTEGKVRFEIDADTLITSKGKPFLFAYRVDKRDAQHITMKAFSNDNQGGYTYNNVDEIAKSILGGNRIFVRVITWDNEYLDANISLAGSDSAIKKVFKDCGCDASLTGSNKTKKETYSLEKFKRDFSKLSPANQQGFLDDLRKLIKKY